MDAADPSLATLFDAPSPAVLTTYRSDGSAVASPVWFRRIGNALEVVIADGDVKLRHLAGHPTCSLLVFEAAPPFRAVRAEGEPSLHRDEVEQTRRSIAQRYLGVEAGDAFTASRGPGVVLRVPLDTARCWDLQAILP